MRNSSYMGDQSAIAVNRDSRADIRDNVLGHPPGRGPRGSQPFGIRALGSVVNIARNEISGFWTPEENEQLGFGIQLAGAHGTVGGSPGARNVVRDSGIGLEVGGSSAGVTVSHNLVLRNKVAGISADFFSSGNLFVDNVSVSNTFDDCRDNSRGSGTAGRANTWTDNIGTPRGDPAVAELCPARPG